MVDVLARPRLRRLPLRPGSSTGRRGGARPERQPLATQRGQVWRDVVLACVLLALSFWQNLSDIPLTPFHPDETRWLNRAHYVADLRHPFGPTWDDGYLTRGQPPLGSYLMGVGLLAQGRDLETNGVWDFKHGEQWNTEQGNMASPADLRAGRRTNAMVGALTVVAVYFLGKRLTNWAGGLTGALFLAAHPLHLYLSSQAVSDALLVLILALAALVACSVADRPTWPRVALLGALLGLGGATKLSPLLITLPLAGLGALLLTLGWWRRRHSADGSQQRPRLGAMLLALPLLAMVTFVAVYPYLWTDPVGNTHNLFGFRVEEMAKQGSNWPDVAVDSRTEALRRVGITLEDRFSTSGRLFAKLMHGLGRTTDFRGIDVPFAIVGGEILLALMVMRGLGSRYTLVVLILGAQAAAIVLGMRSDWARYHLPVLLAAAVCVGVLGGTVWSWLVGAPPLVHLRQRVSRLIGRVIPAIVPMR